MLMNLKQEVQKLKSRIVYSPEKLVQLIQEMKANLVIEKTAVVNLEKKSRDLQMKIENFTIVEQDIVESKRVLDQVEIEMKKYNELSKELTNLQDAISKQQAIIRDYEGKIQVSLRVLTKVEMQKIN
jgi:predicted  nucleic acid-binding Zn-ribbon protein